MPSYLGGEVHTKNFSKTFSHGDPLGTFSLGSTIVLIFEAPKEEFIWNLKVGHKVKVGEIIASVNNTEG